MKNYLEVGKELMKNKTMAKFSHYIAGNLYYKVQLEDGVYQFPIATVEEGGGLIETTRLASDLGTTAFSAEMKGSELNRWIRKALEKGEFIRVG